MISLISLQLLRFQFFGLKASSESSFEVGDPVCQPAMAPLALLMVLTVVVSATGAHAANNDNALDYGYWNYREGADRVDVATVRSVTRVLDTWGKRIFSEIKSLLHSQPSTLLPDYSRVQPLSESLSDLFREVSLLHYRITELSHRLATLDPFLRRYGYKDEEEAGRGGQGLTLRLEAATLAQSSPVRKGSPLPHWVVRRRRVRVNKNGEKRLVLGKT